MASSNKYKIQKNGSRVSKPILISAITAVAVLGGSLAFLSYKMSDEGKIAALRYAFNKYYPSTFDTIEEIIDDANLDGDALTNAEEYRIGTNIFATDSDSDGIIDSMEVNYGTDPLRADTDGDGIRDGDEVQADGLDPLEASSDGRIPDKDRTFVIERTIGDCSLRLVGNAGIYSATFEQLSLNAVASNAGALTFPYELYCDGEFIHADMKFSYSEALVKAAGISPENIKVFRFDPYRKEYSVVGGAVDQKNCTVSCSIPESGVYVLGADKVIQQAEITDDSPINVHLLIDNSGSMYSKKYLSNSAENDVNFKRLTFASRFVTELKAEANVAISAFTYDVRKMCEFTSDKAQVIQSISDIRDLGPGFDGTSVERALMRGLDTFTEDMRAARNVIIILTDGISTDTAGYTLDKIVASAQAKNVTIMTISLGSEYDRDLLTSIADLTGGKYFQISEANILEGLYSTMIATMENDIVDEDMDGTPDSYTLFDTGFDAELNGFSFPNFKSKTCGTLDFGMSMLARDWFRNMVKNESDTEDKNLSYTFLGTTIDTKQPLSNVRLACMQSNYLNPDNYLDYTCEGKKLKIETDVILKARELGWSATTVPFTVEGKEWTEAEILVPDHLSGTLRTAYTQDDYQMIRAIHYYESFRGSGKQFSLNRESDLARVKSCLGTGTPLLTKMTWNSNGTYYSRYVLLTTLRRSLDNPNIFRLKVYDVNDLTSYMVTLTRTPTVSGGGSDNYTYSADWKGREVSLSFSLAEAGTK